ncbi:MAG: replication initiation negative regulator SeqA [Aeromonadaceae bacterium]|jgi:Negative regulator of replication initiationR|nr:replication initiation negative regulator SeqA [Aeromonadaceae bacterium]MBP8772631.1 replication initiation negative regulator SeqA [Aeromonadaceae bacterium]
MKTIEVDEELYRYIARQTQHIGESASEILRRLLGMTPLNGEETYLSAYPETEESPVAGFVQTVELSELLNSSELAAKESAIDRFMLILSSLYQANPDAFTNATEIKGRKRIYFARTEEELRATGNTTKPKPVPGTPYWVISNTNTGRKRNIVGLLMTAMGYSAEFIEQVCEKI